MQIDKGFTPLREFGHFTQQAIMPIIAIADEEIIPLGTGFVISPDGFLMTAKHVIEEFSIEKPLRRDGNGHYKSFSLYAIYISDKKHGDNDQFNLGGLLPINKAWSSSEIDIAYCWVNLPYFSDTKEKLRIPSTRISPGVPEVGENIIGFGYYKSVAELTAEYMNGNQVANYEQNTAFTTGNIIEIHSPKRDSGMLNFPCFQTSARFEPGMSGGPIFNEKGFVCGVICSGYKELTDEQGFITYCSMIWPALGTSLEIKPSQEEPLQMITAYEIAKKGHFQTDDTLGDIGLVMNDDGTRSVYIKSKT